MSLKPPAARERLLSEAGILFSFSGLTRVMYIVGKEARYIVR
jgi:hypothetical protein